MRLSTESYVSEFELREDFLSLHSLTTELTKPPCLVMVEVRCSDSTTCYRSTSLQLWAHSLLCTHAIVSAW